ncbi:MAG: DUF89 family protein [Deltaproteobacteria bacterium]|nr:DUF89 family protein [Deltaproteobacteria bacterium]
MKPDLNCAPCLLTWLSERIMMFGRTEDHYQAVTSILRDLQEGFQADVNVGSLANRTIESVSEYLYESAEHYKKIKSKNNQTALEALPAAKDFIENGLTQEQKFERACSLAAAGNIAPLSSPSRVFEFQEVEEIVGGNRPMPLISERIFQVAQKAVNVLYLADNAGEIGFDALLISRLKEMGARVTLVVKDGPFFEDATLEDAAFFSIDESADEILGTKGFFVPSESPSPLLEAFKKSDFVISKGTGNFEALEGETEGKPTIFMLKVKCQSISKKLQMDMGEFAVKLVE